MVILRAVLSLAAAGAAEKNGNVPLEEESAEHYVGPAKAAVYCRSKGQWIRALPGTTDRSGIAARGLQQGLAGYIFSYPEV